MPPNTTDNKSSGEVASGDTELPIFTPMIPIITSTKVTPGNYSSVHYPVPTLSGPVHSGPGTGNYTGQAPEITGPANTAGYIPTALPSSALFHDHGRPPVETSSPAAPNIPTPAEPLSAIYTVPPFRGGSPTADGNNSSEVQSSNGPTPTAASPFAYELGKPLLNPAPANDSDIEGRPAGSLEDIAERASLFPYRGWCWRAEIPKGNSTLEDKMKHLRCKGKPIMDTLEDVLDFLDEQRKKAEDRRNKIDEAQEKRTANDEDDDEVTGSRAAILPYRPWCWRVEIPQGNSTLEDKFKHLQCKGKPIMDTLEDVLDFVDEQRKKAEEGRKKIDEAREKGGADAEDEDED